MLAAETFRDLITNLPHLEFELSLEALTGLILAPLFRLFLRRHDRVRHSAPEKRSPSTFHLGRRIPAWSMDDKVFDNATGILISVIEEDTYGWRALTPGRFPGHWRTRKNAARAIHAMWLQNQG